LSCAYPGLNRDFSCNFKQKKQRYGTETPDTVLVLGFLIRYCKVRIFVFQGDWGEPADITAQQNGNIQHHSGHQAQAVGREPAAHQVSRGEQSGI